ncbi:MAG: hypothetical protein L3J39_09770 [Verrucomicrobiales bacterium]|nr:hypothetical protein [Verrucomicrobiales bacterium]
MPYFSSKKNKASTVRSGDKKKSRRPGCLLILAVLYLILLAEGMRAKHDWTTYTEHWQSKGKIFDLQELIPEKLPSADNFAEHPIISELFNSNVTPTLKKLSLAEIPHLQQAIRFTRHSISTRDRNSALGSARYSLIDYIAAPHTIPNEHQAAEFILEQLKPLHLLFDQLEQASKAP